MVRCNTITASCTLQRVQPLAHAVLTEDVFGRGKDAMESTIVETIPTKLTAVCFYVLT